MKNHFRIYNDLWYPKAHPYVTNLILKYLIGVGELIRKNALKGSWGGRGGVIMKKMEILVKESKMQATKAPLVGVGAGYCSGK